MLSNLLVNIEMIIRRQFELDDSQVEGIVAILKNYKKGHWIYPGIIKRKIGISISESYLLLQSLENEGILESYYELNCCNCNKTTGIVYKTFNEIPETFECDNCDEELASIDNAVMLFKVIKDE